MADEDRGTGDEGGFSEGGPRAGDEGGEEPNGDEGLSPYRPDTLQPLNNESEDGFGHGDYVKAIVEAVSEFPRRFTLGLFGAWGSGKSSVLAEVGSRLNAIGEPKTAYVGFDAWRYEDDSLRREFVREVGMGLKQSGALPRGFDLRKRLAPFDVGVSVPRGAGLRVSRAALGSAAIASGVALALILLAYLAISLFGWEGETKVKVAVAVIGPLLSFVLVAAGRVAMPVTIQESRERFDRPEQFAQSFEEILGQVRAKRLVIGVDNLDRCSPERLTELLATIKTFLEPAAGAKGKGPEQVCFIIAADDEALRRHLVTEEMSRSGGRSEPEAREAVDEYLRKFFNGSVRIGQMLPEEMDAYCADELRGFLVKHRLADTAAAGELVAMTSQALKHNPRRVKQFVNNLELRVAVLEKRRAAKRFQIEPDLLAVAKLAIIEEEFAEEFVELRREPRLLAEWQEMVAEAGEHQKLDDRLVAFLRFSDHIQPREVGAYLSEKQSVDERVLPDYLRFADLLEDGSGERLDELLSELEPEEQAGYRTAAERYFDDSVKRKAWSRAHNATRAMLESEALAAEGELGVHALDEALSHPELKERLAQLEVELVLETGGLGLPDTRFGELVGVLMDEVREPRSETARERISLGLVAARERLGDRAGQLVKEAYEADGVRDDFGAYVELAEVWPEMVSAAAVSDALEGLEGGAIEGRDPRLRVAAAGLSVAGKESGLTERFVNAVRPELGEAMRRDPEELHWLAGRVRAVVEVAEEVEAMAAIAEEIAAGWEESEGDARWTTIGLGLVLCERSGVADERAGEALGGRLVEMEETPKVREWLDRRRGRLPVQFKAGVKRALQAQIAGEAEAVARGVELAEGLEVGEREEMLLEAAAQCLVEDRHEAAAVVLEQLDEKQREGLLRDELQRLGEKPGQLVKRLGALRFVIGEQHALGAEQREALAELMVGSMVSDKANAPTLGPELAKVKIDDPDARLRTVQRMVDLEQGTQMIERRDGMLSGAWGVAGTASSRAKALVDERLKELEEGGSAEEQAMAIRVRERE